MSQGPLALLGLLEQPAIKQVLEKEGPEGVTSRAAVEDLELQGLLDRIGKVWALLFVALSVQKLPEKSAELLTHHQNGWVKPPILQPRGL